MNFGTASEQGQNSFYSRWLGVKYVKNMTASPLVAKYNWWGTASPDSSKLFQGPVTFRPFLTLAGCAEMEAKIAATEVTAVPVDFRLHQNFPNPFNPSTTIGFTLPVEQQVRLDLFNVLGQQVRSFDLGLTPAGHGSVFWNGRNEAGRPVGSGIYFYRIWTPLFAETKKMLLLK